MALVQAVARPELRGYVVDRHDPVAGHHPPQEPQQAFAIAEDMLFEGIELNGNRSPAGGCPPFLVVGASAALATLDLDFGSGFFHYCFYLFATVLLRWLAGPRAAAVG